MNEDICQSPTYNGKKWKKPKCRTVGEWLSKEIWYIPCSGITQSMIRYFFEESLMTWKNAYDIMLSGNYGQQVFVQYDLKFVMMIIIIYI